MHSYESCLPRLGYAEQNLRALDHAGRVTDAVGGILGTAHRHQFASILNGT